MFNAQAGRVASKTLRRSRALTPFRFGCVFKLTRICELNENVMNGVDADHILVIPRVKF